MRFKKGKRVLALVMAVLMVVGLMPVMNWGEREVSAVGKKYVLESSALDAAGAGTFTDGQAVTAGTDKFFTMYMSAKTKIDSSSKTWDDGYESGQRLNFGGKADIKVPKNCVSFKTKNKATVKIWWVEGGDDKREMAIYTADGTEVAKSTEGATTAKNAVAISTLTLENAGTYYLGGDINNNNIYKIEVTEETAEPEIKDYIFESSALDAAGAGTFTDGQAVTAGTDKFFTMYMSAKTKIDSSSKTWDDGYESGQRLNFGGKADIKVPKNCVSFKTKGKATVKIWWVEGGDDKREMAIYTADGTEVAKSTEGATTAKNAVAISTLTLDKAGTYYLGGDINNNNIYKIVVTDVVGDIVEPEQKPWDEVEAPVLGTPSLKVDNSGVIVVPYTMVIDDIEGADFVEITVKDKDGNVVGTLKSLIPGASGEKEYTPAASGEYTFSIKACRADETDKVGNEVKFNFTLPLTKSSIGLIYNKGNGTASLDWSAVKEATSYAVEYSADGTTWETKDAGDALTAEVSGLTVGTEYLFRVVAKRGDDATTSDVVKLKITSEAQQAWGYIAYGNGASQSNGKYEGSVNEDGKVTMSAGKWSQNADGTWTSGSNNGKWVPASYDGLGFYYTTVPASMNFTLRAKVTVNEWFLSNAQEAFGLIANDRLGGSGWNNSYSAYISKNEYYWDAAESEVTTDTSAQKVTQKFGIGAQEKIGLTTENIGKIEANDSATIQSDFKASTYPLEQRYPESANVIGNGVNTEANPSITEMYLSIQKNNTGYFVTYESVDGSYKMTKKYYDTKALEQLDSENVYVGFFLARYGNVTFSDITFTTIDPADDAPAEERPKEIIAVNTSIQSPTATGNKTYEFAFAANCDGSLAIYDANGKAIAENVAVAANKTVKPATTELSIGKNNYKFVFTPDANYVPGEYQIMESYEPIEIKHTVSYAVYGNSGESLWVAPDAKGNGTKANPMSIYDAVKYVQPGQTIVLMGGTYNLEKTVKVERGINGTADKKIYMVADPDAAERPVLDFGGICAGMVLAGDYWVFRGFDVTNSADAQKGIQVSGNYNLLDSINAYRNGNTGIQISRYLTTDEYENWPAYNTILNCTSYGNADKGFEDADGFAAKLTVGDGNVFDGCIAHHNADDGWDLFAKVQSGRIGSVTIKNSVAYANGYTEAGGEAGNGNGFKMGGDSLEGQHVLQNCVAYNNKAKGIDSNSCPDIIVKDCITYNNGSYNVAFYTNTATNTDFSADNVISFRTVATDVAEQLKFKGEQKEEKVYKDTNYFWDATSKKSLNKSGAEATADWFESLDTSVVPTRNADGTINMHSLLKVTDKAPEVMRTAGLTASTASEATVIPPSISAEDIKTGDTTPIALYVILAIASMAVLAGAALVGKKRLSK